MPEPDTPCVGVFPRGLSPPTISDTSGLQVNFASIPDQAAPDLIGSGGLFEVSRVSS